MLLLRLLIRFFFFFFFIFITWQVREAFTFTFDAYMHNGFPKDELNPLSCKGEDTIGSYALTLVDALDTLAVMGNWTEFAKATRWVKGNLNFGEINETVSLFETNIRVLGGLLSAHLLSESFQENSETICAGQLEEGGGDGVEGEGEELERRRRRTRINANRLTLAEQCESEEVRELREYQGELLAIASDLGDRLARAFEDPIRNKKTTRTGIPFGAVNLATGVNKNESELASTAGAATLAIEFGTLSRLTGNPKFLELAKKAMKSIWNRRSRLTGLVGAHINITSGAWTHLDAGIGAGIDSYFEYLLKSNVLLAIDEFGDMFHQAYHSVEDNLRVGPWYVEVNMDNGVIVWPLFNALQAFWPGLQTLMASCAGDHKPFRNGLLKSKSHYRRMASYEELVNKFHSDYDEEDVLHDGYGCSNRSDVENHDLAKAINTHGAMFAVWKRHGATPEGYSLSHVEPQKGQSAYPLRPELIESTYYLYLTTRDPAYLVVGREMLSSIQSRCRVKPPGCGYAALADVDTGKLRDHMESFFLAETLKYLYLLFDAGSKKLGEAHRVVSELPQDFIFSTEGHLFPLISKLSLFGNGTPKGEEGKRNSTADNEAYEDDEAYDTESDLGCVDVERGKYNCDNVIEGYCRPLHPIWNVPRYKTHYLPAASPHGRNAQVGQENAEQYAVGSGGVDNAMKTAGFLESFSFDNSLSKQLAKLRALLYKQLTMYAFQGEGQDMENLKEEVDKLIEDKSDSLLKSVGGEQTSSSDSIEEADEASSSNPSCSYEKDQVPGSSQIS